MNANELENVNSPEKTLHEDASEKINIPSANTDGKELAPAEHGDTLSEESTAQVSAGYEDPAAQGGEPEPASNGIFFVPVFVAVNANFAINVNAAANANAAMNANVATTVNATVVANANAGFNANASMNVNTIE